MSHLYQEYMSIQSVHTIVSVILSSYVWLYVHTIRMVGKFRGG